VPFIGSLNFYYCYKTVDADLLLFLAPIVGTHYRVMIGK